jgi:hypothetical protein
MRQINPSTGGTYDLGSTSSGTWKDIHLSGKAYLTAIKAESGSNFNIESPFRPDIGNSHDMGQSSARFRTVYVNTVDFSNGITANGSVGMSRTAYMNNSGCFLQFQLGVLINSNC